MRVILLGNYGPDRQQSMLRWGDLLARELPRRGWSTVSVAPSPIVTRWVRAGVGAKWAGYLDKYVAFPRRLSARIAAEASRGKLLVHVVDHSNAVYIPRRKSPARWIATCHDLLAVRGALGEDTDCPASLLGKRLQRAIVAGLSRADAIAADSSSTLDDLNRLVAPKGAQFRRRILLGQNHPYRRVPGDAAQSRLVAVAGAPWRQPFVLHVGSNLARKNKLGIVRVFAALAQRWSGNLIFCGAPLPAEIRAQALAAGIGDRVFAVPHLDNTQLEAAYNCAHALLYPSKCEGFGWPVAEAQACGCPVVCSDRTSLPEVGGEAALIHAFEDETGMAESILKLADPEFRTAVIARSLQNAERFSTDAMIDAYVALYEEVLCRSARA